MELSKIELSNITFYMKLDNIVLEHIQIQYGTLMDFEIRLIGAKKSIDEDGKVKLVQGEPEVAVVNDVLPLMIREGMEIAGREMEYSADDIIRLIDKNIYVMADVIHQEFKKSIAVENPKKAKPSLMSRTESKEKKQFSIFLRFMLLVRQGLGLEKKR